MNCIIHLRSIGPIPTWALYLLDVQQDSVRLMGVSPRMATKGQGTRCGQPLPDLGEQGPLIEQRRAKGRRGRMKGVK
jgi:hypothetical protein